MANKEAPDKDLSEGLPQYPPLNISPVKGEYVGLDRYPFDEKEMTEVINACKKYDCREGSRAHNQWQYRLWVGGGPQIKLGYHLLQARTKNALEQFKKTQKEPTHV